MTASATEMTLYLDSAVGWQQVGIARAAAFMKLFKKSGQWNTLRMKSDGRQCENVNKYSYVEKWGCEKVLGPEEALKSERNSLFICWKLWILPLGFSVTVFSVCTADRFEWCSSRYSYFFVFRQMEQSLAECCWFYYFENAHVHTSLEHSALHCIVLLHLRNLLNAYFNAFKRNENIYRNWFQLKWHLLYWKTQRKVILECWNIQREEKHWTLCNNNSPQCCMIFW